ncbi:cellular tumor antigen p53-like isoform X2 [Xenia sp. Carnegie-2017]|nr:cellular tumor antigen p53-like isoform X2 [Xenia sp. Carnegie-2017]XP_046850604.1 cellular tumor antigen p53-like isoform X2 [Xenia sp. Carnegie-2017]XP_046850605.1 cellular tumor antigen p53-like isoform X2 [Xenia sp. Carnegie-2017]XP_046850606.1 cellular tumor antigen p53-like isoform X2 [Xenia sp. Carnegie-2017]XP_046850607.1 cellular tumor antigen p53-like isoform X2 [Xenia sp. Carnegie-2017]
MSQSDQPSSQESDILSQGTFQEIWASLQRTFSDPTCVLDTIPRKIEYRDQDYKDHDEVEISYTKYNFQEKKESLPSTNGHDDESSMLNGESLVVNEEIELAPILSNKDYPGRYHFGIEFEPTVFPITKATPCVYVEERKKLFVKMQCVIPIMFKIKGNPPSGSGIRGILMYKKPEHYREIVVRCPNHKNTCSEKYPEHVMRCDNPQTRYESCPKTKRLSIFIPLNAMKPDDSGYRKELFRFTCFNSCVGGMNRRPTHLSFRLECGSRVEGITVVELRICASPGRDSSEKDLGSNSKLNKHQDNEPSSTTDVTSSTTTLYPPRQSVLMSTVKDSSSPKPFQFSITQGQQPRKRLNPYLSDGFVVKRGKWSQECAADSSSSSDETFYLKVHGQRRYELLTKINEALHLLDGVKAPDQIQNKCASDERSPPEFTKILPRVHDKIQDVHSEIQLESSFQSSQEVNELSQLSRTSSNASSQSSQSSSSSGKFSAEIFTLKQLLPFQSNLKKII